MINTNQNDFYKYTSESYLSPIESMSDYSKKILTFIPRVESLHDFPSHGIDHSLRIIVYINKFIEEFQIDISDYEAFLLYVAAWTHDIGCICGRELHHRNSFKILKDECDFFRNGLDETSQTCLNFIILSHRKQYNINSVSLNFNGVRLRYICAIFRLMDACDITRDRCPMIVYKYIKNDLSEESQNFWEVHLSIVSVTFFEKKIVIDTDDKELIENYISTEFMGEINSISEIFSNNGIKLKIQISCCFDGIEEEV